jgi:hypothetical protein
MVYQKLREIQIVNRTYIAKGTKSPSARSITENSETTLIVVRFRSFGKFLPF